MTAISAQLLSISMKYFQFTEIWVKKLNKELDKALPLEKSNFRLHTI
jgi:hypothetical protein